MGDAHASRDADNPYAPPKSATRDEPATGDDGDLTRNEEAMVEHMRSGRGWLIAGGTIALLQAAAGLVLALAGIVALVAGRAPSDTLALRAAALIAYGALHAFIALCFLRYEAAIRRAAGSGRRTDLTVAQRRGRLSTISFFVWIGLLLFGGWAVFLL